MNDEKKKKVYLLFIFVFAAIIIVSVVIIFHALKPKVDYEAMVTEMCEYVYKYDNVTDIKAVSERQYKITVKGDPWYNASERDKMVFFART